MKYPRSKPGILSVCLMIAASLAVYFSIGSSGDAGGDRDQGGGAHAPPPPALDTKVSHRPEDPKREPRPGEGIAGKVMSLEEIKRRWLALRAIDPSVGMSDEDVAEREKLAIESLRSLKLSAGAFELADFLRQNGIPINRNGTGLLQFHRRILEADPAFWRELKDSFVPALHDAGGKVAATSPWGAMAAMLADFGTDLEFEELYQDLKGPQPELGKKALLNRGTYWVKESPDQLAGIMESTLQRLGEVGGLGGVDAHALVNLVGYESSAEQCKRTLEVLNEFSAKNTGVNLSLVKKAAVANWASTDPIHVADMVLSDSSLNSDELMRTIASRGWHVVEREQGLEGLLQWLSSIPSELAKRNAIEGAAMSMAANYLEGGRDPEHVNSLEEARQISNLLPPEEREKVFGAGSPLNRDLASEGKK